MIVVNTKRRLPRTHLPSCAAHPLATTQSGNIPNTKRRLAIPDSMRKALPFVFAVAVFLLFVPYGRVQSPTLEQSRSPRVNLLIAHGLVIDGSGSEASTADVGIRGDRIVFIGNAAKEKLSAARVIDASGLIVAPGFIDPH